MKKGSGSIVVKVLVLLIGRLSLISVPPLLDGELYDKFKLFWIKGVCQMQ